MIDVLLLIGGFVALSGLMAMIDAAVLSVTAADVEVMEHRKLPFATALRKVNDNITRSVIVIVIITNTINILGPILVGQKAIQLYGSTVIGIITAVLTFATIIFSEIIPKSIGAHRAPQISRLSAPAILACIYLLFPLVWILEKVADAFKTEDLKVGTEAQIRALTQLGRRAGHIESDEGQLIHRAFILNDKTAGDIMTPLKDVIGVSQEDTIRDAADKVMKHSYSRYPVFGSAIHDIEGLVMSKDILEAITEGKDTQSVKVIMRESLLVDINKPCDELIVLFRDKHIHLAIVQDDDHTVGLVTLEDVLEELVGDIEDEMDVEDA